MLTPLLAKALTLNQALYKYGPYLKHPIVWNSARLRFEYRTKTETLPWALSIIVIDGLALGLCFHLLFIGLNDPLQNKGINWMVTAVTAVAAIHLIGANPNLYFESNLGCTFVNAVLYYEMRRERLQNLIRPQGSILELTLRESRLLLSNPRECDIFGLAVSNMVLFYNQMPYVVIISGVALSVLLNTDVDPVFLTLVSMHCNPKHWMVQVARPLLIFIFVSEMFRRHFFDVFASLLVTTSLHKALKKIDRITENDLSAGVDAYIKYFLLQESGDSIQRSFATWLHVLGYGTMVINGTAVILGPDLLPPMVYGISVSLMVVSVIIFMIVYPRVTSCYNFSLEWINKCKLAVVMSPLRSKKDQRILQRKIRTLRPICFYFGSFRKLDNEAKTAFIESLIDQTASFLVFIKET